MHIRCLGQHCAVNYIVPILSEHQSSSSCIADSMSEVLMVMVECSLRSLRTVDSHVVFGLPVGRFTGLMKCRSQRRDCPAGVSGGSLIRWPNQDSLFFIIMTLQGFMWVRLYRSSVDMRRGQLTRITCRSSLHWKNQFCLQGIWLMPIFQNCIRKYFQCTL